MSRSRCIQLPLSGGLAGNLLDVAPVGVIVLVERNTVVWANSRAESLARDGWLKLDGGRLRGSTATRTRRLFDVIDSTSRGDSDGPRARLVELGATGRSRRLQLIACRLAEEATPFPMPRPAVLLLLCDPDHRPQIPSSLVEKLYDLTPSEARIATSMATGRSVGEIADELKIQPNTVRFHLKSVYAKTGTTRQTDLVRLLLLGPAVIGSFFK